MALSCMSYNSLMAHETEQFPRWQLVPEAFRSPSWQLALAETTKTFAKFHRIERERINAGTSEPSPLGNLDLTTSAQNGGI